MQHIGKALGPLGYRKIEMPPLKQKDLDAFDGLPEDPYYGERWRQFSQYILFFEDTDWAIRLLKHRPFIQAKAYNQKVGGVERKLEPIVDLDPLPQISHLARELEFDVNHVFQVNLHRWRTRVSETFRGDTVPEGAHRDGHHITSVTCWSRENIEGGESVLYHIGKYEPFLTTILEPGECLVLRDEDLIHGALPIALKNGADEGHRDIFVISINPWGDRRYGREFEAFSKAKS